jgi:asparagine synthase (glutamine-hydrolysing)
MCGIAGYVGPGRLEAERIRRALELMRHRGPDHAAHMAFDLPTGRRVELLHTRLSIIDLDPRANQPFHHGDTWLAFNGMLYNYRELGPGEPSDTAVLCAQLDAGGAAALDRCEGMWAFAAFNERTGELLLSRDRFGEKPLYLLRDPHGGIYFGSEPKFLFALAGRVPPVNRRHLQRYLVNGYKSLYKTSETFFEGLEQLPPGHLLTIAADGSERREPYWRVRHDPGEMSLDEAAAGVRERLIRSVELRLRADVPLAFMMSGGIDSTSLIAIARRELGFDVHGFTAVNTDERYEEQEMVDHAVAELGVRHTPIELGTDGFVGRLRSLVRHHDAPVSTITYYVHWLLMEAVHAAGYRVSVSGTAADELYSGYYDHHLFHLREVNLDPATLAGWRAHVAPVVRNPFLSDPERFARDPGFRDHIYLGADQFREYLTGPFDEGFAEADYTPDLLRNRMLNELFHEAVPVILHEDDLNAMRVSIENRSPFLDRALFEHALTIPTRHLIVDGRAKAVLRQSMRGIVPDRILDNRRKVGFNAPIEALLDTSDPAVREEMLADSPFFEHVRREKVAALLDRPNPLPNSESKLLFNLLNAKLFLEEVA